MGITMSYNKYAQYPNKPGLVFVRNRIYTLYEVFGTDNIRAKIKYCEEVLSEKYPHAIDGRNQYEYLEMPNTDILDIKNIANKIEAVGLENVITE